MIPKVVFVGRDRGGKSVKDFGTSMKPVVLYLFGAGKANEHVGQRVVAGSDTFVQEYAGVVGVGGWPAGERADLALRLESDWRHWVSAAGVGSEGAGHVFHASLALGRGEGVRSDEWWNQVASEFMGELGFDGAQWVAVRHGVSGNGNDHVHVVGCLVRGDGSWVDRTQIIQRAQDSCRDIEARHGLRVLKDYRSERGMPGYTMAEAARARAEGRHETDRQTLARLVRAASVEASNEGEFIGVCQQAGLRIRPFFVRGQEGVVGGYSVALSKGEGEKSLWLGGSKLARDLALPALRARWEQSEQELEQAGRVWAGEERAPLPQGLSMEQVREAEHAQAVRALREALRGTRGGTTSGVDAGQVAAKVVDECAKRVGECVREASSGSVVPGDVTWLRHTAVLRDAASTAAGLLAGYSADVEKDSPGALAHASSVLSRSAQPERGHEATSEKQHGRGVGRQGVGASGVLGAVRAVSKSKDMGWLAVVRQLDRLTQAVHDLHEVRGEAVAAARVAQAAGQALNHERERLAKVEAGAKRARAASVSAVKDSSVNADAIQRTGVNRSSKRASGQEPGRD